MNGAVTVVEVIQAMLAPAVMISACGLLLLGMNNKYSLVVNRIRLLNEEKRKFFARAHERDFRYDEEIRLKSIAVQLERLHYRVKLVRNAVFSYSSAIAFFVLTSFIIGVSFFFQSRKNDLIIVLCFTIGMLCVFIGIIYAAYETIKGYQIVSYEIKADE